MFSIPEESKQLLDSKSFQFNHNLNDNLLNLETLKYIIKDTPVHNLAFSSNKANLNSNFESILRDKNQTFDVNNLEKLLLNSESYIALSHIENHPLLKDLCTKISNTIRNTYKKKIRGASYWLFIASPNTVTPFHFDRFSNFIFQIHGTKELAVFPSFNSEILNPKDCERYCDGELVQSPWNESIDQMAKKYHFTPGEAVHIPFTSAHYVKNGSDSISITISVFYHTPQTLLWSRAMRFNNIIRKKLIFFGDMISDIHQNSRTNIIKAYALPLLKVFNR